MNVEKYFELNEPAFRISPDPRYMYYSGQVKEAIEKCKYMARNRIGPLNLYGPIGSGKTTLLKQLYNLFRDEKPYLVAHLISPNIKTSNAFLRVIMDEFGVKTARAYAQSLRNFERFLLDQRSEGTIPMLLVDEGQNMNRDMLRLLHYLLNCETAQAKLLQIVVAGQESLAGRIQKFRELSSRMFPIALSGMSPDDLAAMIEYRWMVAGGEKPPFSKAAHKVIFAATRGLPRDAVKLCDECLRHMAAKGMKTIKPSEVEAVAESLNLEV